ncbi:hypothetical protein LRM36_05130 [Stenotrophomonas maltophilia]|nr:hypothetical protein [Stenotrophomonas maltophilia]
MANRTQELGVVNAGGSVIEFPMHRVKRSRNEDEYLPLVDRFLLERMLEVIYAEMDNRAGDARLRE